MSEISTKRVKDDSLAFFGKIVAGQSHEVTNVLNIINELAGLQEDVLQAVDNDHPVDILKLKKVSEKIRFQVERGETIIKNINRFAHNVDLPTAVFDLKETLSQIVFLAERWTRLKKSKLVPAFPKTTVALEANPFFFVQAVFLCIDAVLLTTTNDQTITVSYSVTGNGAQIVITSSHPVPSNEEVETKIVALRTLLDTVDGELKALPGDEERHRFIFFVSNQQRRSKNGFAEVTED